MASPKFFGECSRNVIHVSSADDSLLGVTMAWLQKHLFEVLVTVIVSLLAYIGNEKLQSLASFEKNTREQLETVSCKINTVSARDTFGRFEFDMLGRSLDDLSVNSPELVKLKGLKDAFTSLATCLDGKHLLADTSSLYDGLVAYVSGDIDIAINDFSQLPLDRAFTQQVLGSAYYKKSLRYAAGSSDNQKYLSMANDHTAQFGRLATGEIGGLVKQPDIKRYNCNTLSRRTRNGGMTAQAIRCLNDLVAEGIADHNTYYNLAALYARDLQFEKSLSFLKSAAKLDVRHDITQNYLRNDPDFSALAKDSHYQSEWETAVQLFAN